MLKLWLLLNNYGWSVAVLVRNKDVSTVSFVKIHLILLVLQYGWSWCKSHIDVVRTLRFHQMDALVLWIGSYIKSSKQTRFLTCFYLQVEFGASLPSGRDHQHTNFSHFKLSFDFSFSIQCLSTWVVLLLAPEGSRYLPACGSGKIAILAGLWVRKKCFSCRLV